MVNWKEFRRKRSWPSFKVLSRHSPGGIEENQENPQNSWYTDRDLNPKRPKYEASVNHSATTFCQFLLLMNMRITNNFKSKQAMIL
jgi:hypothetical protein